jgi:hypothetical protein
MGTKAKRRKPETVKVGNVALKIYRRQKTIKSKLKGGTPTSLDVYVIPEPGTAFLLTIPALLCVRQRLRK